MAAAENRVIGILIDLPGPKIRLGRLVCEPVELERGNEVVLTTDPSPTDPAKIPVDYPALPTLLGPGNLLYINDGLVRLRVLAAGGDEIRAEVLIGGALTSRKGLNVLDSVLPVDAVTCRDLELIEVGLALGVHTFTISFIERAESIRTAREHAASLGHKITVIAKIERRAAVDHIDEILAAAPVGHPLAGAGPIPEGMLKADDLILLEDGHCLRDQALAAVNIEAPRGEDVFAATSLHTLVQMVSSGLGVSFLPQMAVQAGLADNPGVVVRPISADAPRREIVVAWRAGSSRAAEARLLAEALKLD